LFVGMAAGTYSSIFIATPLVVQLKESEDEVKAQGRRVHARRDKEARAAATARTEAEAVGVGSGPGTGAVTRRVSSGASKRTQPQRAPRSKRGKRT